MIEGYSATDIERFVGEPSKRPERSEFTRDRARIIHSFALRRLAAKTQVAVPWADDFPRTRLSHSLECAQVGREIGIALGADPDLMDTACLAHDLGHPPFGHNGEKALDEIAESAGGFEGNAQSFRILTRLESKTRDQNGRSIGLNLTRASLDAATKYPWPKPDGSGKFGVYDDDLQIFEWVRSGIAKEKTSLEAQIMDWSDDIAYSVHDLEDGIVTGKIIAADISVRSAEIATHLREHFIADASSDEIEAAQRSLSSLAHWPIQFDLSHGDLSRLKNLTSELIGRFAKAAESETRARFGTGPLTRYNADLVIPRASRIEVAFLKSISSLFIINAESSREHYAGQRSFLKELTERIYQGAPQTLETFFLEEWQNAGDDRARLRVVIDQVASFTDLGAYKMASRLGIKQPKVED
jgi:dGTPase